MPRPPRRPIGGGGWRTRRVAPPSHTSSRARAWGADPFLVTAPLPPPLYPRPAPPTPPALCRSRTGHRGERSPPPHLSRSRLSPLVASHLTPYPSPHHPPPSRPRMGDGAPTPTTPLAHRIASPPIPPLYRLYRTSTEPGLVTHLLRWGGGVVTAHLPRPPPSLGRCECLPARLRYPTQRVGPATAQPSAPLRLQRGGREVRGVDDASPPTPLTYISPGQRRCRPGGGWARACPPQLAAARAFSHRPAWCATTPAACLV